MEMSSASDEDQLAQEGFVKSGNCLRCELLLQEIKRLQAIVDKLPKCWRLNALGKLIKDVPVVPGMRVWRLEWPIALGEQVLEVDSQDRMRLGGQSYMYSGEEVASTREAAKRKSGPPLY